MRIAILVAVAAALASCSDKAAPCLPPTGGGGSQALSRPILGFDDTAVLAANQAQLPQGFTNPQRTACAPDTSRAFIAELVNHSITDVQVKFHWAPVVSGPITQVPPVQQPEFAAAGTVKRMNRSSLDFPFDHPFGYDLNLYLQADSGYEFLARAESTDTKDEIHTEIEMGLFPETEFGYVPAPGDRMLLKGAWIFDCGHPPYGLEMHPPSFLAFAREADANTAVSVAFVSPYRVTQTFSRDGSVATGFEGTERYTQSKPFPDHFLDEILAAAASRIDRINAHVLLEPTRFDTISWSVCAPSPRPAGARFAASWRFTARSGVSVTATADEAAGCVRITAKMTSEYKALTPVRMDWEYPWAELSRDASNEAGTQIDVRQTIVDTLASLGQTGDYPALRADRGPYISTYPPLKPRVGANLDTPTAIINGANDQPFPFYGRVRAAWCGQTTATP